MYSGNTLKIRIRAATAENQFGQFGVLNVVPTFPFQKYLIVRTPEISKT